MVKVWLERMDAEVEDVRITWYPFGMRCARYIPDLEIG